MNYALLLFLGLFAGFALANPSSEHDKLGIDQQFLARQKDILRLFKYVNQPSYYKDHVEIASNFKIDTNRYLEPKVAEHFSKLYSYGILDKDAIFSVFYHQHLEEAKALFRLFYYAKDYQTFYETAIWARNNVNPGLYLYSLSVAIVHRNDTFDIILPPIYEIYPYYFYNSEVIESAHIYKQQYRGDQKTYIINANYSGYYLNLHPEQSLSYFTEDVGINAFYYYYNLYYPFWMDGEEYNLKYEKRGELYYYTYQQILARYYLERLSNGFGEIEWFNWELPLRTGYYPSLSYPNGLEFPSRPNYANLYEYFYNYGQKWSFKGPYGYSYTFVQDYERRIRDAIDKGYVYNKNGSKVDLYSEDGFNILGNLIESNPDSPNYRYYGSLQTYARHLLGYSYQPLDSNRVVPSVLEHFETSLRDPTFYQFYKRIVMYFQKYKLRLPFYTEKDLVFNGVKVDNVEFDRLVTYFDYFYSDITNAVYVTSDEYKDNNSIHVKTRQHRLNHKPFTYKIHVNSDKVTKASVRVYLGPKYDEYHRFINLTENRLNFVLFDHFLYDLKTGQNVISRNSHENFLYKPERMTYKELYQKVMEGKLQAISSSYLGFPLRFLLPKGTSDGYEFQFYVIVSPFKPYKGGKQEDKVRGGELYLDGYPLGYPFDRFIEYEQLYYYNVPNSYFFTTKIYHTNKETIDH